MSTDQVFVQPARLLNSVHRVDRFLHQLTICAGTTWPPKVLRFRQEYINYARSTLTLGPYLEEPGGMSSRVWRRRLIAGVLWIRAFEGSRSGGGRGQLRPSYGILNRVSWSCGG